ncbi:MAG: phosphatase PAP2 family protein [Candidatus Limnocylindria bacterium]
MTPLRAGGRRILRSGMAALLVIGIAIIVALALLVVSGRSEPFDDAVIRFVRQPALDGLLWPLGVVTQLGSTGAVIVVGAITLVTGVLIGPWLHGLIGAVTIALASIGNGLFKVTIARARPDLLEPIVVEHGFSFPSGHSALGMVAYGVLGVLVMRSRLPIAARRRIVAALGILIMLIGVSRVWLGVHYPTDVLAGWTAGIVIVLAYARLTRGVSPEPAAAAVDVDPAASRSAPPATGSNAPRR